MNAERTGGPAVAVVCGSGTPTGRAAVSRLRDAGWQVVAADFSAGDAAPHATAALHGDLADGSFWKDVEAYLRANSLTPQAFIHCLSGFDGYAGPYPDHADVSYAPLVLSAELGCQALIPLMANGSAIVFVASVLAEWDTRPDGEFAASQAGLLALARAQALAGGPNGIRVNTVCIGLVEDVPDAVSPEVRGRIPLGRAARPDEVVDAIQFLISPDARHISGSTLVVDGGQSLQSWSNAPRDHSYPLRDAPNRDALTLNERFRGRTVLITGAAGGLGSATARRFGAEGARLALLDRDGEAVTRLAGQLTAQGRDAFPLAADVADERSMAGAIERAEQHFGQLDVLFNNAGIGSSNISVVDMAAGDWDEVIAINLRGVYLGCKYGVPALRRAGGGVIVNMGSSTGRHDTIAGGAAYMASKAAVEAFTKALAIQVAPDRIRANTICPGIIQTQLSFKQQERGDEERFFAEFAARIPIGRVGQPDDVAAAVAFLASDQASHITGAALLIDGGQTLRRWVSAPDLAFAREMSR